jgi:hypothetical protein
MLDNITHRNLVNVKGIIDVEDLGSNLANFSTSLSHNGIGRTTDTRAFAKKHWHAWLADVSPFWKLSVTPSNQEGEEGFQHNQQIPFIPESGWWSISTSTIPYPMSTKLNVYAIASAASVLKYAAPHTCTDHPFPAILPVNDCQKLKQLGRCNTEPAAVYCQHTCKLCSDSKGNTGEPRGFPISAIGSAINLRSNECGLSSVRIHSLKWTAWRCGLPPKEGDDMQADTFTER